MPRAEELKPAKPEAESKAPKAKADARVAIAAMRGALILC
jgi:hypothetical protein